MVSFIPDSSQTDEEVVADLISALSRRMRRDAMAALEVPGLTPGRLRALRVLDRSEHPMRMGELADVLDMVPRSATTVVDDLADEGLVRRIPDPDDRRATLVEVTASGRKLLAGAAKVRSAVAERMFGDLSPTEITRLRTILSKLAV